MLKKGLFVFDILFAIILIFLAGLSYLSYERIERMRQLAESVNHANLVKLSVNQAILHTIAAESWERGYLLTRDTTFLINAEQNLSKIDSVTKVAIHLTADNPKQQKEVKHLAKKLLTRKEILEQIHKGDTVGIKTEKRLKSIIADGRVVLDSSRASLAKILATENNLLGVRIKMKNQAGLFTPILVLVSSIIGILLVIFAYLKMRTETNLRRNAQISEAESRKMQLQIAELNASLEAKVDERTRELQDKNIALGNMNDELLSFNYVASHDLQEPLRKIQAFSNRIIDSDNTLSEKTADHLSRINAAALRMQSLLEALISYSRASNADADFILTDLNKTLDEVKADLHEMLAEKQVEIVNDGMPELKVIPMQVHQLFQNVIANSVKYAKPGIPLKINIKTDKINASQNKKLLHLPYQNYWQISFADNGIGFEPIYEDKIFELFQRLHGKNEFGGTGIGLAICRKIAQNHNGYITAEGRPDNGATFFIYFPA
ncbi:MAG: hypothetical protein EOO48_02165 [Flavobacterium sp.]|nr:MAG: hypothetical protein EOO48_02165 [Flavobacterium sp.]